MSDEFTLLLNNENSIIGLVKAIENKPIVSVDIVDGKKFINGIEIKLGITKYIDGEFINPENAEIIKENNETELNAYLELNKLKRWFSSNYRYYNEKLTRFEALSIIEPVTDAVFGSTYYNLMDLYNQAEMVRNRIKSLES